MPTGSTARRCAAPAGGTDHATVAVAGCEAGELARAHAPVGKRQLVRVLCSTVPGAAPEQCDLDPLALVQARESADAIGGSVSGREEDRLHVTSAHARRRP